MEEWTESMTVRELVDLLKGFQQHATVSLIKHRYEESGEERIGLSVGGGEYVLLTCPANANVEVGEIVEKDRPVDDGAKPDDKDLEINRLKRQVEIAKAYTTWIAMNSEYEEWTTMRDKAIEAEFNINHPECFDGEIRS